MVYGRWHDLLPIALTLKDEVTWGELVVGGGTALLAVFTALLAFFTFRLARRTGEQVRLTGESIEALDRPFVVVTPNALHAVLGFRDMATAIDKRSPIRRFLSGRLTVGKGPPAYRFLYRLWNIGKGPAIVDNVSLRGDGGEFLAVPEIEWAVAATVNWGRDEMALLVNDAPPGVGAELELRLGYRSSSGRRYETRSVITVEDGLNCNCRNFERLLWDSGKQAWTRSPS